MPLDLQRHPETAIAPGRTTRAPYRKTHPFEGGRIDAGHAAYDACPTNGAVIDLGVPGWLLRTDALKLHECAHFARGDVLELGTYQGLSALVMARAMEGAGRPGRVVTLELSRDFARRARANLEAAGLLGRVDIRVGDAARALAALGAEGRRFGFAFVDHSHAYGPMVAACRALPPLLEPGALVAFHDYNDPRNTRRAEAGESDDEYGVVAAVEDALDPGAFEFMGVYGAIGLFRRL